MLRPRSTIPRGKTTCVRKGRRRVYASACEKSNSLMPGVCSSIWISGASGAELNTRPSMRPSSSSTVAGVFCKSLTVSSFASTPLTDSNCRNRLGTPVPSGPRLIFMPFNCVSSVTALSSRRNSQTGSVNRLPRDMRPWRSASACSVEPLCTKAISVLPALRRCRFSCEPSDGCKVTLMPCLARVAAYFLPNSSYALLSCPVDRLTWRGGAGSTSQ